MTLEGCRAILISVEALSPESIMRFTPTDSRKPIGLRDFGAFGHRG